MEQRVIATTFMEQNPEKIAVLTKERQNYVVKSNDFLKQLRNTMAFRQQRLLLTIISKIKPGDTPDTEYTIAIKDFAFLCGCKQNYTAIKNIAKKMDEKFWMDNLKNDGDDYLISFFHKAIFRKQIGTISFVFHEDIRPFLFELKNRFTRYPLIYILRMKSSYSIKLYELLKMYVEEMPQRNYYHFRLEGLKTRLGAGHYKTWQDFKTKCLEPALGDLNQKYDFNCSDGDINKYSDLRVTYRVEKEGKKVIGVVFHAMKKEQNEIEKIVGDSQIILNGDMIDPDAIIPWQEQTIESQLTMEDLADEEMFIMNGDNEHMDS